MICPAYKTAFPYLFYTVQLLQKPWLSACLNQGLFYHHHRLHQNKNHPIKRHLSAVSSFRNSQTFLNFLKNIGALWILVPIYRTKVVPLISLCEITKQKISIRIWKKDKWECWKNIPSKSVTFLELNLNRYYLCQLDYLFYKFFYF